MRRGINRVDLKVFDVRRGFALLEEIVINEGTPDDGDFMDDHLTVEIVDGRVHVFVPSPDDRSSGPSTRPVACRSRDQKQGRRRSAPRRCPKGSALPSPTEEHGAQQHEEKHAAEAGLASRGQLARTAAAGGFGLRDLTALRQPGGVFDS